MPSSSHSGPRCGVAVQTRSVGKLYTRAGIQNAARTAVPCVAQFTPNRVRFPNSRGQIAQVLGLRGLAGRRRCQIETQWGPDRTHSTKISPKRARGRNKALRAGLEAPMKDIRKQCRLQRRRGGVGGALSGPPGRLGEPGAPSRARGRAVRPVGPCALPEVTRLLVLRALPACAPGAPARAWPGGPVPPPWAAARRPG